MRANDIRPAEPTRHGAYICLSIPAAERAAVASADVTELAESVGLRNEYGASGGDPRQSVAYLRRVSAEPGQIDDQPLLNADVVVHVAAPGPGPVQEFQARLAALLPAAISPRLLAGVVLPPAYTGMAMHNFAYGHRIVQQPGTVMPSVFLVPMRKTAAWWDKHWMEQHTYFLPQYDDAGRMRSQGHALAAAAGISCLLRRTYKHPAPPAADGQYDFITYFECTDDDVPAYRQVRDALRDTARNPEWQYVSEGPTWHGRRAGSWAELFAEPSPG
jgi:hypothetical protein